MTEDEVQEAENKLAMEYLADHDNNRLEAATQFCRDLMRGGKRLQRGYTADSARIAAKDIFRLTESEQIALEEHII